MLELLQVALGQAEGGAGRKGVGDHGCIGHGALVFMIRMRNSISNICCDNDERVNMAESMEQITQPRADSVEHLHTAIVIMIILAVINVKLI